MSAYFQLETNPGCQLLVSCCSSLRSLVPVLHLYPSVTPRMQVRAVSTRLIDLHTLLGSRQDIDVGQMLICEPRSEHILFNIYLCCMTKNCQMLFHCQLLGAVNMQAAHNRSP